eukprot:1141455-Prymnesium_polylepis.1
MSLATSLPTSAAASPPPSSSRGSRRACSTDACGPPRPPTSDGARPGRHWLGARRRGGVGWSGSRVAMHGGSTAGR